MKKLILIFTVIFFTLVSSFAQNNNGNNRRLELSIYGGTQRYVKTENSYIREFGSKGVGFGMQYKYSLTNYVYWVGNMEGSTDNGNYISIREGVYTSLYRVDYSISNGLGINIYSNNLINIYGQGLLGIGFINATVPKVMEKPDLQHKSKISYHLTASTGLDFKVFNNWKIGAFYSFKYLGLFDANHYYAIRLTYIVP